MKNRLTFVFPTKEYEQAVMGYKKEFLVNGDSMDGCGGLDKDWTYDEWQKACEDCLHEETVPFDWAPATTYLAVNEEGIVVGMVNIRHRLSDFLLRRGGHIGYSVRKSQRRKGYATEILRMALEECKKLGIERALVTCSKANVGSARTIQKNGGILENEVAEGERITQRYWIDVR